jgi:ectoine hydroxylase-related dioxygenase (phytanoyl-CoA dioxygenase family)
MARRAAQNEMTVDEAGNNTIEDMDSSDEALCEMLGLESLHAAADEDDGGGSCSIADFFALADREYVHQLVEKYSLSHLYETEAMCVFPKDLCVPAELMRRLTDELVWGGTNVQADRTYETIRVLTTNGEIQERQALTRLENFVSHHTEWSKLCNGYLKDCISAVCGQPMVVFKEKLNLKPAGGSGFAPHLDTPSLRVALGDSGPQTFVTVMVAVDNMTSSNGCLRVCKGSWTEQNHVQVLEPDKNGNPDAGMMRFHSHFRTILSIAHIMDVFLYLMNVGGRAGAIPENVAESLEFSDVECPGGSIVAFNGYVPHRSAANGSPFARRAVFLTYNPESEGEFHELYYFRMNELREHWRTKEGLSGAKIISADKKTDLEALATIPRI